MTNTTPTFVDDLHIPRKASTQMWDALIERPGVWAEYWGKSPTNAYGHVRSVSRKGFRFEAGMLDGKSYVRAVKA